MRKPFRHKPAAIGALVFLVLIVSSAVLAGALSPYDPLEQNIEARLTPPSAKNFFGTDGFGRDVFSRILYASRTSLFAGLAAVILSSTAGVVVGVSSAYLGGRFDMLIQRVVDLFLGFPFLILAIVTVILFTPSAVSVAAAISIALAPQLARVSRGASLPILSEDYISAARLSGVPGYAIMVHHILPNSLPTVLAQATGFFGTAVAAEATLSFLGIGVPPPYPSWGGMLLEGTRQYFEAAPWVTLFPGVVLSLTVVSFSLLGDALGEAVDRGSH